ncbi:MAG TPA: SMI1/KNR4 family protein [Blastocatellia bacterium]|nr:SMI1/KNR4 family protein [Blastocatellia bacterium]
MGRLTENLKNYWSSIGTTTRSGVDPTSIASFESRYNVRFPEDFRDYITTIDGIEDGNWDDEMISFWPLHCVKSVPEALTPFAGIPDYSRIANRLRDASSYFVFADFLIWSHVYAIRLGTRGSDKNNILWICGSKYYSVAESFSDFLQMYLDNPESIVFPKS